MLTDRLTNRQMWLKLNLLVGGNDRSECRHLAFYFFVYTTHFVMYLAHVCSVWLFKMKEWKIIYSLKPIMYKILSKCSIIVREIYDALEYFCATPDCQASQSALFKWTRQLRQSRQQQSHTIQAKQRTQHITCGLHYTKRPTIHQATIMLAISKNALFTGHKPPVNYQ